MTQDEFDREEAAEAANEPPQFKPIPGRTRAMPGHTLHDVFLALVVDGFTQDQALVIVGHILATTKGLP